MATLRTTANRSVRGQATLELTPNSPDKRELVDTYSLRLWVHDQLVYDQIHSVRNWQMRHYDVASIAKGFCCVQQLLGQRISCPTNDDPQEGTFVSYVNANLSTDWLTVYLRATRVKSGELVHADVYLRKTRNEIGNVKHPRQGQWGEWEGVILARIFCRPDDAIAFGNRLLEEIKQVENARIALGIPEYDDED